MVNRVEKIIGSAEKNRVGREPEPQVFFFYAQQEIAATLKKMWPRPRKYVATPTKLFWTATFEILANTLAGKHALKFPAGVGVI